MTGSASTLLDASDKGNMSPVQEQVPTQAKRPDVEAISIPMHRLSNTEDGPSQVITPESTPFESEAKTQDPGLKRRLQSKQMQMIAIGANMGVGLFLGSSSALYSGGPGFILIDFIIVAIMLFFVVMALAEMATTFPVSGSFVTYTTRFIDPALGFAMGWNYWLQWLVALPIQITAANIIISKWDVNNTVPAAVWIILFLLLVSMINFFGIRLYGQINYWMSMIKVTAVAVFVILAIAIDAGAGPSNHYRGAKTWHDPGAFKNGMKGFCDLFVTAAFSLAGTELIGLTAAETSNPRKEVPKATVQVFWKVVACYIISLFMIGLIVPSNDERLAGDTQSPVSPFVLAIELAGIKGLPHVFNIIILISLISVGNSSVYASSRTLLALAQLGQAPQIFGRIDSKGRPAHAMVLAISFGLFAFAQYASSATDIFRWLLALSGLASMFTWTSICYAHVRFRMAWKRQGHRLEELPWTSPTGVVGSIIGITMNVLALLFNFYTAAWPIEESLDGRARAKAFFQAYLAAPIVIILYVVAKIVRPTPRVELQDIDLQTGRRQVSVEDLIAERQADAARPLWRRTFELFCH
ncbi:unnamed protein product [Tilletia laevis]|uniref:Amino acid permease/ SLC12A domain-containing protein n=3 Tax=Tilletia TaxID=13289 RepID=A0A8X7SYT2_9BASI|nr:hypothetical protein CF336_g4969 [Tilletia laevis]KAE8203572.1 hypothetical protein CF328_g1575 [Tilletia controversa]KAE8258659.1 hypothetical protein A4X03_0g4315 [Tilletia caries]KAE8199184.1 hypothetical protein CF335_g4227 [Tilletia laevis]KAE8252672.1 hypothetical protein A4X06_0g2009 [Tilletia controversa]